MYEFDGSNDYIYRHIHKAAEKMIELSDKETKDELEYRSAKSNGKRCF